MLAVSAHSGHNAQRRIGPDGRGIIIWSRHQPRINQVVSAIQGIIGKSGTVRTEPTGGGISWGVRVRVDQTAHQRTESDRATRDIAEQTSSSKLVVIHNVDRSNRAPYEDESDDLLRTTNRINATSIGDTKAAGGAGTILRPPNDQKFFGWWDGKTLRLIDAVIIIDYSSATVDVQSALDKHSTVPSTPSSVTGHELEHARDGFTEEYRKRYENETRVREYENKYLRKKLGLGAREVDVLNKP